MRRGGRQGRGERARIERRVREVLGTADAVAAAGDAGTVETHDRSEFPRAAEHLAVQRAPAAPVAGEPLRPTRHRAPGFAARVVGRVLARSAVRLDASRSTAVAMAVVIAVVALVVGAWVLSARPEAVPLGGTAAAPRTTASSASSPTALPLGSRTAPSGRPPPAPAGPSGSLPSAAPSSGSGVPLVVDVAGRVHRPGLYHLPAGARVDDAVRAAGGALPGVDLATLNLAAALVDGEQVAVGIAPAPGAAPAAAAAGRASATAASPVHLNTATADLLATLPGVGPVLAQHIVDFRTAHGSFTSVDQLNDVPGIGDSKFAELRASVVL